MIKTRETIELPHRVECSCGTEETVTREDVEPKRGWSLRDQVNDALTRKGWWWTRTGALCPECFDALE